MEIVTVGVYEKIVNTCSTSFAKKKVACQIFFSEINMSQIENKCRKAGTTCAKDGHGGETR
jgi:hypothetical protein